MRQREGGRRVPAGGRVGGGPVRRGGATSARRTRAPLEASRVASRAVLDRALHEVHAGPAWHGPSVKGALRGVSAAQAARAPGPGRNSIWEIVLHVAYARHRIVGRLSPGVRARFPRALRKAWWPRLPAERDERAWKADLALLDASERALRDAVARAPLRLLAERRPGRRHTRGEEVLGVAFHDAYHAGQISLVRRLLAAGSPASSG